MRNLIRVVPVLLVALVAMGATSCDPSATPETVELTILHTNDLHQHYRADAADSEKNPYNLGGIGRLKTLVDRLRAGKPNTVLLDAGDWSEGIMYFAAEAGSDMLRIMDAIGYDAVVVGNHDFLNGPTQLASTIERANPRFPVLGANKNVEAVADRARIEQLVPDYSILNVGGVRVGVIGLLTEDFFYYDYFKPGRITSAVESASRIAQRMHDEKLADVIVLLSHNLFDTNVKWAKAVPWVNVVISGHSHRKINQPVTTTNAGRTVYIAEARHWAHYLGEMQLVVEKSTGKVTLKSYQLHPVTSDIPEDPAIMKLVEDSERKLNEKFGTDVRHDHVGHCTDEMVQDDTREVPLANLAADSYREATGAQIALESVQLIGAGIVAGSLSTMNVFDIQPHIYGPYGDPAFPERGRTWTLKKMQVNGLTLRGIFNFLFIAENMGLIGHVTFSGGEVTYQGINGGMSPARTIKVRNAATGQLETIRDDATYSLAFHDGLLLAMRLITEKLGINLDLSRLEETGIEGWIAIARHISQKGTVRAVDYEAGTRYRPLEYDLAFYEHDLKALRDGSGRTILQLTIKNEGLAPSPEGILLRALASSPNDPLGDRIFGNERFPVAEDFRIPSIAPGGRATVELPWLTAEPRAMYALLIHTMGTGDGNTKNNVLLAHRRAP